VIAPLRLGETSSCCGTAFLPLPRKLYSDGSAFFHNYYYGKR